MRPPTSCTTVSCPLTLHPQEQQLLVKRRELLAEQGSPVLPSGTPLAVGNSLLVQSHAGVMAIDFESGKRLWIEGKLAPSAITNRGQNEVEERGVHPLDSLFYDTTSSTLSSNGELVFVVDRDTSPTSRQRLLQRSGSAPLTAATAWLPMTFQTMDNSSGNFHVSMRNCQTSNQTPGGS